jgi:transcriptional regulator with XRE-family HTH domain
MTPNDNIARCRVAAGLTHQQLARRLGITRRQWWRMETNRIRILAAEMPGIAQALDTTVSALYGELASRRRTDGPQQAVRP